MDMFERLLSGRGGKGRDGEGREGASDVALHRAAQRGDGEAMAALYRRHGGLIFRFSLRMCGDAAVAEEVTQEVFLALMRKGDRYDAGRGQLGTWLCGIARRQVWKQLEKQQRFVPLESDEDETFDVESPDDDAVATLTRKEAMEAVRRGVDELPPHWKEAIVLCEFEEMSYAEAAQVIGVAVGTVRSRLSRAKGRLRMVLAEPPVGVRPVGTQKDEMR